MRSSNDGEHVGRVSLCDPAMELWHSQRTRVDQALRLNAV